MKINAIRRSVFWLSALTVAALAAYATLAGLPESAMSRTSTEPAPPAITVTLDHKPDARPGIPDGATFADGYQWGLQALLQDGEAVAFSPGGPAGSATLAKAIAHAANLGATAIDLSIAACDDEGSPADVRAVAGAIYYAAVVRDVADITAAEHLAAPGLGCSSGAAATTSTGTPPRKTDR
ncbi:hypothetical protein BKG82_26535 [Mycobacteroides chelonae]|uniref:Uncharacterized protein n=1 Tax=Mycobacteroides chelonae TaxID=1774 RepID=A0A1S1LII1_MYCCH|nr:hypothetical protein [Mycobacteroides chelonae]OHU47216.1 hypothetical protein BKG82_26535 [Mycobacteroides chelonae]